MRDRKTLARLALALVEGSLRFGEEADEMFVDTFQSLEEAAHAHAYLTGYVVQFLAIERGETVHQTVNAIRSTLNERIDPAPSAAWGGFTRTRMRTHGRRGAARRLRRGGRLRHSPSRSS